MEMMMVTGAAQKIVIWSAVIDGDLALAPCPVLVPCLCLFLSPFPVPVLSRDFEIAFYR